MYAFLCNRSGGTMPGTDSVIRVDGRGNRQNQLQSVRNYKESFKKNFRHKYDGMDSRLFCPQY